MLKNISFSGVAPAYRDSSNRHITPISKNPTRAEITQAIDATQNTQEAMSGYNGNAFWLGEDLVVKKYKGANAFSNAPSREINMLNTMFDSGLRLNNSQVGNYAFTTETGDTYLVSTKVNGTNPVYPQNPFNKENLASLIDIITQMDMGSIQEHSSANGYSDRCRFMNYDFNGHNINITDTQAGLFDFEYSVIENLDDMIKKTIIDKKGQGNCHRSDTSPLPSSLRSFEFYTFCDYLRSADNADELFDDYLELKGQYHAKMSDFYAKFEKETAFPNEVRTIKVKEKVHSELLRKGEDGKIPQDIRLAEAMKMQMSNFMHEQSKFCDTGIINPNQLRLFTSKALNYFQEQLDKAATKIDVNRTYYYLDCVNLFKDWKSVNASLNEKIENQDPKTLSKLTDNYVATILDVV